MRKILRGSRCMSPFGALLRYLRNERGVDLRTLATQVGLGEKVLSAVETGRRRPLKKDQLEKIKKILRLNEEEAALLLEAARYSEARVRIPLTAKPNEYRLIHRMVEAVGGLSDHQLELMQSVLDRPERKPSAEGGNQMT